MSAWLRIDRGCVVSGQAVLAGATYAVPGQISETDALLIVQLGKAHYVTAPAEPAPVAQTPPTRRAKRRAKDAE